MPVMVVVVGGLGAVFVAKWLLDEGRRVNRILRAHREEPKASETLRPDAGGVYRRRDPAS